MATKSAVDTRFGRLSRVTLAWALGLCLVGGRPATADGIFSGDFESGSLSPDWSSFGTTGVQTYSETTPYDWGATTLNSSAATSYHAYTTTSGAGTVAAAVDALSVAGGGVAGDITVSEFASEFTPVGTTVALTTMDSTYKVSMIYQSWSHTASVGPPHTISWRARFFSDSATDTASTNDFLFCFLIGPTSASSTVPTIDPFFASPGPSFAVDFDDESKAATRTTSGMATTSWVTRGSGTTGLSFSFPLIATTAHTGTYVLVLGVASNTTEEQGVQWDWVQDSATPEPSSAILAGAVGACALAARVRRRFASKAVPSSP